MNDLPYDPDGRRVFLHDVIDEDSVAPVIRKIHSLSAESKAPIELYVCSPGGQVEDALALLDTIRYVTPKVHTYAVGVCMSAAVYIVAAGAKGHRHTMPNCSWLIHSASVGYEGKLASGVTCVEAAKRWSEVCDRLLAKFSKKTYAHYSRLTRAPADHYFDAEQALGWGLVDHILKG